jgi:translation initiation factor IF-1
MSKEELIELSGTVVEVLAGSNFKVAIKHPDGTLGHNVLCYLGGKIRQNSIKIVLHDEVVIQVSPYDANRGKIVFRQK